MVSGWMLHYREWVKSYGEWLDVALRESGGAICTELLDYIIHPMLLSN